MTDKNIQSSNSELKNTTEDTAVCLSNSVTSSTSTQVDTAVADKSSIMEIPFETLGHSWANSGISSEDLIKIARNAPNKHLRAAALVGLLNRADDKAASYLLMSALRHNAVLKHRGAKSESLIPGYEAYLEDFLLGKGQVSKDQSFWRYCWAEVICTVESGQVKSMKESEVFHRLLQLAASYDDELLAIALAYLVLVRGDKEAVNLLLNDVNNYSLFKRFSIYMAGFDNDPELKSHMAQYQADNLTRLQQSIQADIDRSSFIDPLFLRRIAELAQLQNNASILAHAQKNAIDNILLEFNSGATNIFQQNRLLNSLQDILTNLSYDSVQAASFLDYSQSLSKKSSEVDKHNSTLKALQEMLLSCFNDKVDISIREQATRLAALVLRNDMLANEIEQAIADKAHECLQDADSSIRIAALEATLIAITSKAVSSEAKKNYAMNLLKCLDSVNENKGETELDNNDENDDEADIRSKIIMNVPWLLASEAIDNDIKLGFINKVLEKANDETFNSHTVNIYSMTPAILEFAPLKVDAKNSFVAKFPEVLTTEDDFIKSIVLEATNSVLMSSEIQSSTKSLLVCKLLECMRDTESYSIYIQAYNLVCDLLRHRGSELAVIEAKKLTANEIFKLTKEEDSSDPDHKNIPMMFASDLLKCDAVEDYMKHSFVNYILKCLSQTNNNYFAATVLRAVLQSSVIANANKDSIVSYLPSLLEDNTPEVNKHLMHSGTAVLESAFVSDAMKDKLASKVSDNFTNENIECSQSAFKLAPSLLVCAAVTGATKTTIASRLVEIISQHNFHQTQYRSALKIVPAVLACEVVSLEVKTSLVTKSLVIPNSADSIFCDLVESILLQYQRSLGDNDTSFLKQHTPSLLDDGSVRALVVAKLEHYIQMAQQPELDVTTSEQPDVSNSHEKTLEPQRNLTRAKKRRPRSSEKVFKRSLERWNKGESSKRLENSFTAYLNWKKRQPNKIVSSHAKEAERCLQALATRRCKHPG